MSVVMQRVEELTLNNGTKAETLNKYYDAEDTAVHIVLVLLST